MFPAGALDSGLVALQLFGSLQVLSLGTSDFACCMGFQALLLTFG